MFRIIRRFVVKYFGNTRNFIIWLGAVVVAIYVIDNFVLTPDRIEQYVGQRSGGSNGGVINMQQATPKTAAAQNAPDSPATKKCGLSQACPVGQFAYFLKSGEGRDQSPTICFNDKYLMSKEKNNGQRGINLVVINEKTGEPIETRSFDTYMEDSALLRFLKLGISEHHVILGASLDEASANLKMDSKAWLNEYGITLTDNLKFRDAFVFVGQRGLEKGKAIQKVEERGDSEFGKQAVLQGCLSMPLGALHKPDAAAADAEKAKVKEGESRQNCGVKSSCDANHFPVHLTTGRGNTEGPRICVNGKYIMASGLNDAGRGFNVVVYDPKVKEVVRVGHFDTYTDASSNFEIFLEMVKEGEIVLMVTHDDASKHLNLHAKKLLEGLGSSFVAKLGFRDVFSFVGQKGMDGHSPMEQIEFAGPGSSWPKSIDKTMCVPTKITGSKVKLDPLANKNEARRKFCGKYDGYSDFCETEHIDEALTPAPLKDTSLAASGIFDVPIIVIPSLNHNALRMQLETLLLQPGLKVSMVTVTYDEKFDELAALTRLFGFNTYKLSGSTKYVHQVEKALAATWTLYPIAQSVIVLEEEVLVAADFLRFLGALLPVASKDSSLAGISSWNENGYVGLSTMPSLVYRTEVFPGLGFLLKKSYYDAHMKSKMADCCAKRSWNGWTRHAEMLVPDLSRVYRRPYEGLSEEADFLTELFNRQRVTNLNSALNVTDVTQLEAAAYEQALAALLSQAKPLDSSNAQDCLAGKGLGFYVPETSGKAYAIYYEQNSETDDAVLSKLCKCFKLFSLEKYRPRGLHLGLLRFTMKQNHIFFIGSKTVYYKHKPSSHRPVTRSQL